MHPRPGGIVERDAQGGAEVAAEVAVPIFIGRGEQRHQHDERVAVDEGEAGFARPRRGRRRRRCSAAGSRWPHGAIDSLGSGRAGSVEPSEGITDSQPLAIQVIADSQRWTRCSHRRPALRIDRCGLELRTDRDLERARPPKQPLLVIISGGRIVLGAGIDPHVVVEDHHRALARKPLGGEKGAAIAGY